MPFPSEDTPVMVTKMVSFFFIDYDAPTSYKISVIIPEPFGLWQGETKEKSKRIGKSWEIFA
ncbi:hypothetical protein I4300191C4_18080 [Solibaculum mannosilyticum]